MKMVFGGFLDKYFNAYIFRQIPYDLLKPLSDDLIIESFPPYLTTTTRW
jgi:hypothetical protein